MSLAIKIFSAVLILGCAGLFVLKKPDGTPILSVNEFIFDINALMIGARELIGDAKSATSSISSNLTNNTENSTKENTEQTKSEIYRWKDSNGQWQFSDTPPANQTAETMNVSGNLNKDLVATYEPVQEDSIGEDSTNNDPTSTESLAPTTVSPSGVSKLMEDANNIQKRIDERTDQLKKY